MLSTRTSSKKTQVGFVGYRPNLLARQFGHFQFKPNSYFQRKKDLCLSAVGMIEETYIKLLAEQAKDHFELTPSSSRDLFVSPRNSKPGGKTTTPSSLLM